MHYKKLLVIIGIAVVAFVLEFGFHLNLWAQILITIVGALLALSMIFEMIKTLRSGKYGVDLLAILAIVSTLAVGQYWASLIILLMLVGGDTLEDYAANKAGSELKSLLEHAPESAHQQQADCSLQDVALEQVKINDILIVKPGEQVPVDGVITKGSGSLDESSLTGESKPVEKDSGSEVMSGSINGSSALEMKATKLAADSQYQKIIRLVEASQNQPAKFVRLADRYAVPFTLVALIISGIAWAITGDPNRFAQVLVVASPCPLILAAPIAFVSGMSRTSRNGIIVKNGTAIEKLSLLKSIAFDKTGTITRGVLALDKVVPATGFTSEEVQQYAASIEQQSNHILATSLLSSVHTDLLNVTDLKEDTAQGVQGIINNHTIKAGRLSFVAPQHSAPANNQPTIYVSVDEQYAGKITFIDQVRPEAAQTIKDLKQLGINRLRMLTGDNKATAEEIANEVGLSEVDADLMPEDKISALKKTPAANRPLGMVGDGVNDAPSLAVADVGIAMGAKGSSAASEAADVVIVKDDLTRLVRAIIIARETMTIAKQSVLIGIFICVALMLIAALGIIPTIIGALLQEVIDTVSILWSLKARKGKTTFN
ncbi:heavy metal translocating P-type ATPase [Bombilactobacillus thymidiniphilus]|uniref:Cd(2+)-exporting ATPase n=1 Tax=Bombilactobacillus thymidiniphilus TaxID=2923363 RepID=A0ABY4PF59_9LACO|nr:heavy metal translocating P-type ATPase [Bombilactobacillus thymidiniphilus]UQS84280.1 cadmium-translocating P-type ATPase [Bombilactobacillus thymidiniphilus]